MVNIPDEAPPVAGFMVRLAAYLLDSLVTSALVFLFLLPVLPFASFSESSGGGLTIFGRHLSFSNFWLDAYATLAFFLVFLGYAILLLYRYQRTLGMWALGLRLIRQDRTSMDLGAVIIRTTFSLVSSLFCYLGYLWAAADERGRTWHDMAARTCVVRQPRKGN